MNLIYVTKKISIVGLVLGLGILTGCASVPMESTANDAMSKRFSEPTSDKAGLYIFRNSFAGHALTKTVSIDGVALGKTANKVYFHKEISPGDHTLSTESEFSDNSIEFSADAGKNYFARQYIKLGLFIGGAGIEMVSEEEGKNEVLKCDRAKEIDIQVSSK